MMRDTDIRQVASQLFRRYGTVFGREAAELAAELDAERNPAGAADWRRVMLVVDELERPTARRDGQEC